jgi:transcriptional regulator with XRE-family HTH domain
VLAAAEVRAEMGRQGMSNAYLARALGVSEAWTTRRLSLKSADTGLSLTDLERIATVLAVPVLNLLPQSVRAAGGLNLPLRPIVRPAHSASTGTPLRRAASRPMVPNRRDLTRPVSAIPAEHRRPQPTGSSGRRRAA